MIVGEMKAEEIKGDEFPFASDDEPRAEGASVVPEDLLDLAQVEEEAGADGAISTDGREAWVGPLSAQASRRVHATPAPSSGQRDSLGSEADLRTVEHGEACVCEEGAFSPTQGLSAPRDDEASGDVREAGWGPEWDSGGGRAPDDDMRQKVVVVVGPEGPSDPPPDSMTEEQEVVKECEPEEEKGEASCEKEFVPKSVLKRPGGPCKPRRRVTFDESLNTFFDADYVILVRAQDEDDGEEEDKVEEEKECCASERVAVVPVETCGGSCGGLRGRRRRRLVGRGGGCVGHDGFELNIPEIFAFEPPVQFIDQVTLSPPEGYKDEGRPWRGHPVSFAESFEPARLEALRYAEGERREEEAESEEQTEEEKVQRYIVETITLTTVTERRIVREAGDAVGLLGPQQDKQLSGILKGGKLWKSSAEEPSESTCPNPQSSGDQPSPESSPSPQQQQQQEGVRRSVRFHDSAPESDSTKDALISPCQPPSTSPPESTELTLTFRLAGGSNGHILLSQHPPGRPESALRQLFPSGSPGLPDPESLRRLRSAPRGRTSPPASLSPSSSMFLGRENTEDDDLDSPVTRSSSQIRRTIERNALRRSLLLVRGAEPRRREAAYGRGAGEDGGSSLVERIRQLTCGLGDGEEEEEGGGGKEEEVTEDDSEEGRMSEELPRSVLVVLENSPSSTNSCSSSSSSSSTGSTYKKLADLFSRKNASETEDIVPPPPPPPSASLFLDMAFVGPKAAVSRAATTAEARKQLLSTLSVPGDRSSVSTAHTDCYSLEDIDEVLEGERTIPPPPDVVQVEGTPSNESVENGNKPAAETSTGLSGVVDELALFVQRDAGRIERIRKRYSLSDTPNTKPVTTENSTSPVDPEAEAAADDYGFSKRPSVRGIKPRFGSTSQILQEISSPQVVSSARSWPYPPSEQQQPNPAQTSNHLPQQTPVQTNPVAAAAAAAARRRQRGLPMVQEEGTRGFAPLEPMGQYCGQAVGRMVTAPVYASSPPSSSYLRESYQYPMETSHHCTAQHYPYYHHPNDSAEQQTVPRRYPPPHQPNVLHHQQHPYPMVPPQLHPPPHYSQPMHPNHPAFRNPHPNTPGQPPLKPPSPVSFPPSNYYSVPPHSSYPPQYYAPQQYQSPRLFPSNGNNPQEPQYYHHYQQMGPYHHQQYQGAGSPRPTNYPTQGMAWVAPTPACKRPEQQERGVPEGASASPGFPTMDHQPTTTAAATTSLATSTSTGSTASLVTSVSASTLSSSTSTSSSVYYAMNV